MLRKNLKRFLASFIQRIVLPEITPYVRQARALSCDNKRRLICRTAAVQTPALHVFPYIFRKRRLYQLRKLRQLTTVGKPVCSVSVQHNGGQIPSESLVYLKLFAQVAVYRVLRLLISLSRLRKDRQKFILNMYFIVQNSRFFSKKVENTAFAHA